MIHIDLRTTVIPRERRIWRLFPGKGYKFLGDYRQQAAAFLDIPEFPLPASSLRNDPDILKRLAASQEAVEQYRKLGLQPKRPIEFARMPAVRSSKKRVNIRQSLISFFEEAKKGDIIIVPNQLWLATVLIGQLTDDPGTVGEFTSSRYGQLILPGRPVEWITEFAENKLSDGLVRTLRHQNPFSLVQKSQYAEIYSIIYSNFSFSDEFSSVLYNTKDDFLDKDSALIGDISRICAYYAFHNDEGTPVIRPPGLVDLISNDAPIDYSCQQSSDIHSPGFIRFVGTKYTSLVVTAVISAMLALASCNSPQEIAIEREKIVFVNSFSPLDQSCMPAVFTTTKAILANTEVDQLLKMCKALKEAEARAGLETRARIDVH